jgi:predicted nucleic acid-binding protein
LRVYADTSVFVSFYVNDAHSNEARRRIAQPTALLLTPLHRAEWANAIGQHVFRRLISSGEAEAFSIALAKDRKVGLWLEAGIPESAFEISVRLADQYTSRLGTRTLDTLHVASALELGATEFWTFDERQAKLAKAVGLKVS